MTFLVIDDTRQKLSISNLILKNIKVKGRQCPKILFVISSYDKNPCNSHFKLFLHNVEEWPNIILKSCDVNTAKFLKYVRPFLNVMHETIKRTKIFLVNDFLQREVVPSRDSRKLNKYK